MIAHSDSFQIIISVLIIAGFLIGIRLMQLPRTALWGNRLGAFCMVLAILFVFRELEIIGDLFVWLFIILGGGLGIALGQQVKMLQMPQAVALFNGLGGGASALVAGTAAIMYTGNLWFFWVTVTLALAVGTLTFTGSIVATLKLQGWISQKPVFIKGHSNILIILLLVGFLAVIFSFALPTSALLAFLVVVFALYGFLMAIRVGGADMPVIIAVLNSFSGVAASVSGLAINNVLLVGVGALVGVAGMVLTQIMCRAMNRSLLAVLGGIKSELLPPQVERKTVIVKKQSSSLEMLPMLLKEARKVIIIPGYGMALSQAQGVVKELIDVLESKGKEVKLAIHPVAGRMPGHMNVLLAEVGIDYEKFYDLDSINLEFAETDLVIVVGACDVINPAANTAEDTPIYGMPILQAIEAKNVIVCNLDEKPGYSGVDNTLYQEEHVLAMWGDACKTLAQVIAMVS